MERKHAVCEAVVDGEMRHGELKAVIQIVGMRIKASGNKIKE